MDKSYRLFSNKNDICADPKRIDFLRFDVNLRLNINDNVEIILAKHMKTKELLIFAEELIKIAAIISGDYNKITGLYGMNCNTKTKTGDIK